MKVEIDFIPDVFEKLPEMSDYDNNSTTWSTTLGDTPLTGFDVTKFWQSLWVIHDLLHEALTILPSGEIGITITSPSNKSLRYQIKKV